MNKNIFKVFFACLIFFNLTACHKAPKEIPETPSLVNWTHQWNDQIFLDAQESKKPIILSLEANWCHWCHVMKEKNYNNHEIAKLLNDNFILVSVDQDTNPFLASRYKDYGWPATVFFSPDGKEISKQTGFIETAQLKSLLERILKDPYKVLDNSSKSIIYSKNTSLSAELKQQLIRNFKTTTDLNIGGLNISQKYLDRDTVEYALTIYANNTSLLRKIKERNEISPELNTLASDSRSAKAIAKANLDGALKLQDPIWGGFFQYSTNNDWKHLHYEKLTEIQAEYIRTYSYAYLILKDPKYLDAAKKATNYMLNFMKDFDGGFYSSQDADLIAGKKASDYYQLDDLGRRKQGIPRIDKNIFPSKNGLMIDALVKIYKASSNYKFLKAAINSAKFIIKKYKRNDSNDTSYFVHTESDKNYYLADNLYMAKAFLSLYEVTANKEWLYESIATAEFIKNKFRNLDAGYLSSTESSTQTNQFLKPIPILAENIRLARFFNLLYQYTGNPIYRQETEYIMKYLATKEVALGTLTEPGILVVDYELNNDPVHFTLIGPKNNPQAKKLFNELTHVPYIYSRIEWYDPKEGKLLNHDVEYPSFDKPVVFNCENKICSMPIYEVVDLQEKLKL